MNKLIPIPANYPYDAFLHMERKQAGSQNFIAITDPDDIPDEGWALHFVGDHNKSYLRIPLDWRTMSETGRIQIHLTAEDTSRLSGMKLHLVARNDSRPSNILDMPAWTFYFVPNDIR